VRIAVLHFQHETVTFLRNDTRVDDFVPWRQTATSSPAQTDGTSQKKRPNQSSSAAGLSSAM
jgi:hypothetical protein